jgi:hypothetical protein
MAWVDRHRRSARHFDGPLPPLVDGEPDSFPPGAAPPAQPDAGPEGDDMRIATIGLGYVGSVAGACFAATGHDVTFVEVTTTKVGDRYQGLLW